jgi:Flp pilus assembly protein TadG
MAVKRTKKWGTCGQAAVETALALPFLIYLLYYTINAFYSVHTGHIAEKYAAMNLYERLDNRAQFAVDGVAKRVFEKTFMAVQYTDVEGNAPKRRILLTPRFPTSLNVVAGICREPGCN